VTSTVQVYPGPYSTTSQLPVLASAKSRPSTPLGQRFRLGETSVVVEGKVERDAGAGLADGHCPKVHRGGFQLSQGAVVVIGDEDISSSIDGDAAGIDKSAAQGVDGGVGGRGQDLFYGFVPCVADEDIAGLVDRDAVGLLKPLPSDLTTGKNPAARISFTALLN
jgi:hypothetical protein